ncbi:3-hydroxyacyl-CoA dehydrogenase [Pseudomonas chlororaphis]|uniref:3-hydroxyacyl-CoA dehydrogenase NAD-binding domain-containing protein n=1 Tax=Pseudomonas chlororaphis TaxID=587753 RepID=UPI00087B7E33|nr:3-hydroxyacyl-CoA dehydrogenase NAD-binding domain-containing protein [Pseudomonas chlororaphis]AZD66958.1 Enoyl-CoA hydratase [Pseudomonas chlororaphis subsp. aurantiaca]QIT22979.1 3-hydroxyacyl-CoA dehydrogenase [Pseudomonas chlororaphis subsp. aurantiaca]WDH01063.1 3-hydroxyacyl-CoA dehydrogenase NAD-binding domain-containing protein [Pseudomonas chlororaphis]WDH10091.1 3-hydroxyacyl-CoA dehydrogenase NAD-binding domain-containing protein [Pseudomonas chlororaphis]SDT18746.1 3-hydroxyacy
MCDLIHFRLEGGLALIGLSRPPVNALSQPLRAAIIEACERAAADIRVQAIILYGEHGLFSAGADIGEFGTEACFAEPDLPSTLVRLTEIPKPLVAAMGKLALGGALELALACGYRMGEPGTRVGLSEINLGLLPGAGGTQRLPRLIGAESALNLILSGEQIDAERARMLGILDRIANSAEQLLDEACAYANELIECGAPARPAEAWPKPAEDLPDDFLARYRAEHEPRWKSRLAPRLVLSALEAACLLPLEEGLTRELALFKQAEASRQSKALRHVFFAEREAGRVTGIGPDITPRKLDKVAVIGAGPLGAGIAMSFADVGIPVALLDPEGGALDRGLMQIRKLYQASVKHGKMSAAQLQQRMDLLFGTLDYEDLADADLVIEALCEKPDVKRQVFLSLEQVCKPGAILATGTSSLDIDAIAASLGRPQDVIGLHFFSPANVMRLVEVVRGKATAPEVLASAMQIAKRIGKLPVISGAGQGSIGERMLEPYAREAHRLVLEGATPAQVDSVLTGLDLNMGVFSMLDLAGIDVSFLTRDANRAATAHDQSYCCIAQELCALGRYGQKTGRGFYLYEGQNRQEDYEVTALAEQLAGELDVPRRAIEDLEIHDRCLFMLINEGIQLLDEGIALRASDIDLVWINGYGFPAHLGGPLHYAEQLGLDQVLCGILHYRQALGEYGQMWFRPAALLERLVAAGKTRIERI